MSLNQMNLLSFPFRRLVAERILASPVSPRELSDEFGVNSGDMANLLLQFSSAGWIDFNPNSADTVLIHLVAGSAFAFGADVGGTKIASAIVDFAGRILAEVEEATDPRGGKFVFDQIERIARTLAAGISVDVARIRSISIGLPCAVHPKTHIITLAANIIGFDGLNAYDELSARFSGFISVDNDVNLAAVAEHAKGAAKSYSNAAFLALGTGTGLGLIINGDLVRGATGAAGEIGYLPIGDDLASPRALRTGAFEHAAGSLSMLECYRKKAAAPISSVRELFDRHNDGDVWATKALNNTARSVALSIIALQAILDLDLVVLGGSIGVRNELIGLVRKQISSHYLGHIDLAVSELGNKAGLVGAIVTAHRNLLSSIWGLRESNSRIPTIVTSNYDPVTVSLSKTKTMNSSFGKAPA